MSFSPISLCGFKTVQGFVGPLGLRVLVKPHCTPKNLLFICVPKYPCSNDFKYLGMFRLNIIKYFLHTATGFWYYIVFVKYHKNLYLMLFNGIKSARRVMLHKVLIVYFLWSIFLQCNLDNHVDVSSPAKSHSYLEGVC